MGSVPDLMFIIDTNKEAIAIQEAKRLGIPVVAVIDRIAIRTRSITRSRATMTPHALSPCIAI